MLANFIRDDHENILHEWDTFARFLSGNKDLSQVSIRDHGREILEAIADDIEMPQDEAAQIQKSRGQGHTGPLDQIAPIHSGMRVQQGFQFSHLMAEFRALRATVVRLWETAHIDDTGRRDIEGMIRFNESIDQVLAEAVNDHVRVTMEYRDRFTRMLGHDLRTPLTVIELSATTLLKSEILGPKYAKNLSRIFASTKRLQAMANTLQDFARARFGFGIPISPSRGDLTALCKQTLEELETCHPGVRVTFEHSDDLQGTWDPDRLSQVLMNLLTNAVKYGGPQNAIDIAARSRGENVEIEVHNRGPVLPSEVTRGIFEPFVFNASYDIQKFQGGLGLGLCIVKEIVAAHGGEVAVVSSKDAGTTFTVRLPRHSKGNMQADAGVN